MAEAEPRAQRGRLTAMPRESASCTRSTTRSSWSRSPPATSPAPTATAPTAQVADCAECAHLHDDLLAIARATAALPAAPPPARLPADPGRRGDASGRLGWRRFVAAFAAPAARLHPAARRRARRRSASPASSSRALPGRCPSAGAASAPSGPAAAGAASRSGPERCHVRRVGPRRRGGGRARAATQRVDASGRPGDARRRRQRGRLQAEPGATPMASPGRSPARGRRRWRTASRHGRRRTAATRGAERASVTRAGPSALARRSRSPLLGDRASCCSSLAGSSGGDLRLGGLDPTAARWPGEPVRFGAGPRLHSGPCPPNA